ncbi:hypothetical protein AB0O58_13085 [Rhodococcus sp. NPDC080181]|uniref:hypothetical protein n=1 Tax=Rhodococcus sp. NPDC080181 TaxID=3155292 RepID=UPI00344F3469
MAYGPIIDPDFFDREAVLDMQADDETRSALLVLFELMVFSMSAKSNGVIRRNALRRATMHADPEAAMALLVKFGLATETNQGWQIDWTRQKSAEWVTKKQKDGADWDRHIHDNHSACADHPGYNCHKNGDYEKWCAANDLGDLDDDRDGNPLGNPNITQPNSTQPNVVVGEELEVGTEIVVAPLDSAPGGAPSLTPTQEDDSEPTDSAPPKPRKPRREPKVVMQL